MSTHRFHVGEIVSVLHPLTGVAVKAEVLARTFAGTHLGIASAETLVTTKVDGYLLLLEGGERIWVPRDHVLEYGKPLIH